MSSEEKKNTRPIPYPKRFGLFVILVFLLAGMIQGGISLAKYYAQESRKGVSSASGLYFTSNYLKSVSGNDVSDFNLFTENVDSYGWTGTGTCTMRIQVNNFENILLYNSRDLNIMYDLYFQLLETPNSGSYYEVRYYEDNQYKLQTLEKDVPFVLKNQYLEGGSAKYNLTELLFHPENGIDAENYTSKKVAVWAVPTYPDYVVNTSKLAAIMIAVPKKGAFSFEGDFDIYDELANKTWNPNGIQMLNDYSGFVYNIKTTGEDRNVVHYFEITWNNQYIDIDQYNTYYKKAVENNTLAKPTYWTDAVENTTTIKVEAPSYTSMDIHFFKTAGFKPETLGSAAAFRNLVTVKDVPEYLNP